MSNVKITELTNYTSPAGTDVLPIVDLANDQTKKVTVTNFIQFGGGLPTGGTTGQTLIKASGTDYDTTWQSLATCLLYTSPSPRDRTRSRMPSSA